jgi:hypothetical protein
MNNVLVVIADNLEKNSSACIANAAYIKGFLENGYDVTVIMPECDEADKDPGISLPTSIRYCTFQEKGAFTKGIAKAVKPSAFTKTKPSTLTRIKRIIRVQLSKFRQLLVRGFSNSLFYNSRYYISQVIKNYAIYCDKEYDLIISLSSPVAAHYLAEQILDKTPLNAKKWCQIWEDPWYYDLYTDKTKRIYYEENRLLSKADVIEYVTPLTCFYQKQYFPEYAGKMFWSFLPYNNDIFNNESDLRINEASVSKLGYFGEYVSKVRNIMPLVEAVSELNDYKLVICGNSDLDLTHFNNVFPQGRVSVEKVRELQDECGVLVNISNLKGGQIPGKIYQYAATKKQILFVLDGTEEEKSIILDTFSKYNRFIFCDNNKDALRTCLNNLEEVCHNISIKPIKDFTSYSIVNTIISHIYN